MKIAVISAERVRVSRRARVVFAIVAAGLSVARIVILQLIEGCRSFGDYFGSLAVANFFQATREALG